MKLLCVIILFMLVFTITATAQNRVLQLDGDGDYVKLPSNIFNDLDEATIEAWVKWEMFGHYSQPFGFGSGEKWRIMAVNNEDAGPNLQFYIYTNSGKLHLIQVRDILQLNQWHHIAAVSGKNGMKLYLNGVLVGTHDYAGSFSAIQNGDLNYFGRSQWAENTDFLGQLDEIRVWKVARTGQQIRDKMFMRLTGNEDGLVGLWSFDAGDAKDLSENGYDGTLFGDACCVDLGAQDLAHLPSLEELICPTVLSGKVFDDVGNPLNNALISLEQDGKTIKKTITDDAGNYKMVIFPTKESYDLGVTWYEKGDWQLNLNLHPGERRQMVLTLKQTISISGTLLTFDSTLHVGVSVQAVRIDKDKLAKSNFNPQMISTTLSNDGGEYRFINLKPGRYLVRFYTGAWVYYGEKGKDGKEVKGQKSKDYVTRNTQLRKASSRIRDGKILQVERGKTLENIDFRFAPFKKGTWETYTYLDGLPSNDVYDIQQDADGSLWFATGDGICRYDGSQFFNFTKENGLATQRANTILIDSQGILWVGTIEDGAFRGVYPEYKRRDGSQFLKFTKENGFVSNKIWDISEGPNGVLWFGTSDGVCRYDGKTFVQLTTEDGLPSNDISGAIYCDSDGVTWVGTSSGLSCGVSLFDKPMPALEQKETLLPTERSQENSKRFTTLLKDNISAIHRDDSGVLWVGTSGSGVFSYDGKKFVNFTNTDGLANNYVHTIDHDENGNLWFGTDGGVSCYDGKGFINFTTKDGLVSNIIRAIHCDSNGVIWFVTKGGVSCYDRKGIVNITTADGLVNNKINAIHSDFNGALWFGTDGGVSCLSLFFGGLAPEKQNFSDEYQFLNFTTKDGLAENRINDISQTSDGILWFASKRAISRTVYSDLMRRDGQKFDTINRENGLPGQSVTAIHGSTDGKLWLSFGGWAYVGVSHYDGKKFKIFGTGDGLAGLTANVIYTDSDGLLWLGTNKGVAQYDGNHFTNFTVEDGLASNMIKSIYRGQDGILWFGTDDGLSRYDGKQSSPLEKGDKGGFTNFTNETRLGHDRILSICGSSDGTLWFGTSSGGVVGYDGNTFTSLDTRDGLADNAVYDIYEDSSGDLWFGTGNGITRYKRSSSKPSIHIISVQTNKRVVDIQKGVPLQAIGPITAKKRVTIEYQSIDFKTHPEKRQYRYRIYRSGFEPHPYNITNETSIEWSPPKAGDYIFEVQAIDRALNYSQTASINLHVIPPWYLNGWIAIPSGAGILVFLVLSVFPVLATLYSGGNPSDCETNC